MEKEKLGLAHWTSAAGQSTAFQTQQHPESSLGWVAKGCRWRITSNYTKGCRQRKPSNYKQAINF